MDDNRIREQIHHAVQHHCDHAGVQPNPYLAQRVLNAAHEKGEVRVKKKLSVGFIVTIVLLAVTLCSVAIAAANRWGMLDFVDRYATEHYIPQDAQEYVNTDVALMENEWVTVTVRELYYDGRISRVTLDVTPKNKNTLIVGSEVFMEDPFVNLTNNYVQDGENDMRSVYQVIQDENYEQVFAASVFMKGAVDDMVMGTGDFMLGEDGTLTIYSQEEYLTDMPTRDVIISVVVMPFDQPLTMDSVANYEKGEVLETPMTLTASVNPTNEPVKAGEIANVYINEASVKYESVGVCVDRILLEVKPQEIYATIEYSITDREKFNQTDGGLWFEFIDPSKEGDQWEQRLAEGLTGGGSAGPIDREQELPMHYRQTETLGKNELHETYTLRAYDAWEKERYETHEIIMRPAREEDGVK